MKRRAPRLLMLVLALIVGGAIVNVAVAWGCAWFLPIYFGQPRFSPLSGQVAHRKLTAEPKENLGPTHWALLEHRRFGSEQVVVLAIARPFPSTGSFDDLLPRVADFNAALATREAAVVPNKVGHGFFVWDARGWPMRGVACQWPWWQHADWPSPPVSGGISFGSPTKPQPWPFGAFELRALPYAPLWPGFAINTVFYAVILWLLFAAPFALRRRLRRKRGLCPACGYDLRGRGGNSPVCPECGKAVTIQP